MTSSQQPLDHFPGGRDVIEWFGETYDFHDAEIIGLELNRSSPSFLRILCFSFLQDEKGELQRSKQAIVKLTLTEIFDLQLDGFSHQNVIGYLCIDRIDQFHVRKPYFDFCASSDGYELTIGPCYGLDGSIRRNSISFHVRPVTATIDGD